MAIYGIAGKPGSGKTFWAVSHLLSRYFEFNKIHDEFFKKGSIEIISNVENLRLDHYNLDEMIEKAGGVNKFFTVDYQRDLLKRMTRIVYIIDEAGQYFGAKFNDDKVVFFFQYHRHLGIDFYLIAPGVSNICPLIVRLMEYRLQAKPRSKRVLNEFRYEKVVEGDIAGTVILKKDKKVFRLYKSMDMDEVEKVGSVIHKYIALTVAFCIIAVIGFYMFISMMRGKVKSKGVSVANASENRPSLKGEGAKPRQERVGGIPLAEQGVKGGTRGEVPKPEIDFLTLQRDWTKVEIFKDGDHMVVYTGDRFIPREQVGVVLKEGMKVGDKFYVRKKGVESSVQEKEETKQAKKSEAGVERSEPAKQGGLRVGRRGRGVEQAPKKNP